MLPYSAWIIFFTLFANQLHGAISDGLTYRTKSLRRAKSVPAKQKTTTDFLEALDYVTEIHEVTTEDGYILNLHRMPGEKFHENVPKRQKKKVILLQHGLASASDVWTLLGRKSFPYILAKNDFDVWLSNSRGTIYSYQHTNYTTQNKEYWDYTFHENGVYDLRAVIDYILAYTGERKLYYVGYSRGGTDGIVLLSTYPEYNKKIKLYIGYSPSAYVKHAKSKLMQTAYKMIVVRQLKRILDQLGLYHIPILNNILADICDGPGINLCSKAASKVIGPRNTYNTTILPTLFSHFPTRDSLKTIMHYIQIGKSDRFAQFDHGMANNLKKYGQTLPPLYDFTKVTVPAVLYYSRSDELVTEIDVTRLSKALPNVVGLFPINSTNFNHLDVLSGTEPDRLLFYPTLQFISKCSY